MWRRKITCITLVFAFLASCEKESLENQIINSESSTSDSTKRINAWEPPFNLTDELSANEIVTTLQQAIDSAHMENKRLIIEKGNYEINAQITFPSDIYIDFGGAEFKRQSGDVFDMFTNNDQINGNNNIVVHNLVINGNDTNFDYLHRVTESNRFSGLKFTSVVNSELRNITVKNTVNGEVQENNVDTTAGGVLFTKNCENINCYNIDAYNNNGTGILIVRSSKIRIYGSITYDNGGSGISSYIAPRCEYYNLTSYNNGHFNDFIWGIFNCSANNPKNESNNYGCANFSNISVNGDYSKIDGVLTYQATGSGLNIGHSYNASNPESAENNSDFTIVDNVESYGNQLEGVSIFNSDHVIMSNLNVHNNLRNNIRITALSSNIQIQNAVIHGYNRGLNGISSGGSGIRIDSGGGHNINNIEAYDNWGAGIYIRNTSSPVSLGSEVNCYNNGQMNYWGANNPYTSSIHLQDTKQVYINGSKAYSNQNSGEITQKYGIILQNVDDVRVTHPVIYGNGTSNLVLEIGNNGSNVIIEY